jgi:phosphoglycerate dehydrogenase-like enzyme
MTKKYNVNAIFCGTGWASIVDVIRARLPAGVTIRIRDFERPLVDELRDAHVILPSNTLIPAEAIAAATDLMLIQQPAVGIEVVDLAAARARGVPVCNSPAVNADATAQAALLLMLMLARRWPEVARSFDAGIVGEPPGIELAGLTLGIVGLGRIGKRLAAAAEALGMDVVSTGSASTTPDFHDLLARSDFVSIHCPQNETTRDLFSHAAFERMKPGAFLINTARAGIVNRAALEAALDSGRLGGAGLDVYWQEPWDPIEPLFGRDNVVTLPHVGGATTAAYARVAAIVADNTGRVMRGEELRHRII